MSNVTSKEDYLKKYLDDSKESTRKRKKKPKTNAKMPRLKIVDKDINLKSINFGSKSDEEEPDEAPIVAEVIDERPPELRELESSRWQKIGSVSQENSSESRKSFLYRKEDTDISSQRHQFGSAKTGSSSLILKKSLQNSRRTQHDSDSDISPLRVQKERNRHKRHDSDRDKSPPRVQKQNANYKRHDSDKDMSPPRVQKQNVNYKRHDSDKDMSPPRVQKQNVNYKRHDSDSDMSPPRGQKQNVNYKRHDSDSDMSPPRGQKERVSHKRHDSDSDISPTRISKDVNSEKQDPDCDISPPNNSKQSSYKKRNHSYDSDISPPRRASQNSNERHDSNSDASPFHHKNNNVSYRLNEGTHKNSKIDDTFIRSSHSPSRLKTKYSSSSKNKIQKHKNSSDSDISPPHSKSSVETYTLDKRNKPVKTLSGLKAGLQSSDILKKENQELKKREIMHLSMLDDSVSGRNADTIIRDRKTSLKRDLDQEKKIKDKEKEKEEKNQQKYREWGKGIEQTQMKNEKLMHDLYEVSKPLARYTDDQDLDEQLKSIIRDDDPMSEYIKKKRKKDAPSVPVYSGPPAPPNRFGILPGYRWDGVDRSNGFEKRYFEKMNSTKAVQEEAYLWSVQNM